MACSHTDVGIKGSVSDEFMTLLGYHGSAELIYGDNLVVSKVCWRACIRVAKLTINKKQA